MYHVDVVPLEGQCVANSSAYVLAGKTTRGVAQALVLVRCRLIDHVISILSHLRSNEYEVAGS